MNNHVRVDVSLYVLGVALALLPFVAGCGDGQFPVRAAKGKVVCNGQPVTSGSVSFTPIGEAGSLEAGKPASGAVGPDGTFVLSTNGRFDGAVVGKHRVQYVAPEGEEEEDVDVAEGSPEEAALNAKRAQDRQANLKNQCVQSGEIIVEVKSSGDNDFTIELTPAAQ
jgi:hypothetical protein